MDDKATIVAQIMKMKDETDHWRRCDEFPDYEVSRYGVVRQIITKKLAPVNPGGSRGQALVNLKRNNKWYKLCLSRIVAQQFIGLPAGHLVKFKTQNVEDCSVGNLIVFPRLADIVHSSPGHKGCTSKYKGVSWYAKRRRWVAMIQSPSRKKKNLGAFLREREAALAYDRAAKFYFGANAFLNFPQIIQEASIPSSAPSFEKHPS